MKILVLSLDQLVNDSTSAAGKRALEYAKLVDSANTAGKYTVLTPDLTSGSKIAAIGNLRREAERILSAEKYDLISVQDPYFIGLMASRLARKFDVALEVQVHGFERLSWLRRHIARRVLARADGVRAVSKRLERMLVADFDVRPERITIVPIFVEAESKQMQQSDSTSFQSHKVHKKPGSFVFLTVSRLVSIKRVGIQIQAFAKLASVYPQAELWIVGDGPERGSLEALAAVSDRIRFFGKISAGELAQFYTSADAFLLTSASEGWGMVVVEAARHSLPIIMTDVGCAGELIKDGENGIVIPVHCDVSKKALEQAMISLISDPALRTRLGSAAHAAAVKLPTKEQTHALYKSGWEKAVAFHFQKNPSNKMASLILFP